MSQLRDDPASTHYDHRTFIGGDGMYWEKIGRAQFEFMIGRGLNPRDILLDVGCGSLRGGVHFIRYLDPSHYLGIDKHIELIIYGVATELGLEDFRLRQPQFVASNAFEFDKFAVRPTFALAQSLFTHLTIADIGFCLERLRLSAAPDCRFFATFFESDKPRTNAACSNSHEAFWYTRAEMESLGTNAGWRANYIGDWGHPRGQKMVEYVLA